MDLLSIFHALWRHKLVALPIVLFMLLGTVYIFKIKPPVYQASASFLMVPPPLPPSAAQIAQDPKLGRINTNNPYVNLGNMDQVADVVINLVTASSAQQALVQQGADPRYQVVLSTDFESPPILQITGVASSAPEAIKSADLVMSAGVAALYQMQQKQGVNDTYMIKAVRLVQPRTAQETVSSKLRELIVVLSLGVLLLFVAISIMDAMDKRRMTRPAYASLPVGSRHPEAQPLETQPAVTASRDGEREPGQPGTDATMPLRIDGSGTRRAVRR
jgi:capsular polysaccharide biosynthesis protein